MQAPVMQHRAGAAPCARPLPAHTISTGRIHSRAAGAPAFAAQPRSPFPQPSPSRPSSIAGVACRVAQRTFQNAAEEPALIPQSREEAVSDPVLGTRDTPHPTALVGPQHWLPCGPCSVQCGAPTCLLHCPHLPCI